MLFRIIPVKNIARLREAGDALINRAPGVPSMGLIWAPTGYGKTTAVTWFNHQCRGVYIRAMRLWSPNTMLTAIARKLDIDTNDMDKEMMVKAIAQRLSETCRPLFIDEADYVVESKLLSDTLCDIHDLSSAPVILIGSHGTEKRIRVTEQYTGRISQWVQFEGVDRTDCRRLANGLLKVKIDDTLLNQLHAAASPRLGGHGAEIRRLVVGLGRIEQFARSCGLKAISEVDWPKGADFFLRNTTSAERRQNLRPRRAKDTIRRDKTMSLPDGIDALSVKCSQTSQAGVAGLIGHTATEVNQGVYKGNLQPMKEVVSDCLMGTVIKCPAIGEIPRNLCIEHQRRISKFATTNPGRLILSRTCPTCPNNQEGNL